MKLDSMQFATIENVDSGGDSSTSRVRKYCWFVQRTIPIFQSSVYRTGFFAYEYVTLFFRKVTQISSWLTYLSYVS